MQLSKFTSSTLDIIAIYRSQGGNYSDLNRYIELMDSKAIIGDWRYEFLLSCLRNESDKEFLEKQTIYPDFQ